MQKRKTKIVKAQSKMSTRRKRSILTTPKKRKSNKKANLRRRSITP